MFDILTQNNLFNGCSQNELAQLFQRFHYQIKKYDHGEVVAYTGDPINYLYIILEGLVKAEMTDIKKKIVRIENISAPNTLATAFVFGKQNFFPVYVEALKSTKILKISKKNILKMFTHDIKVLQNFLDEISNRTQFLSKKIRFLTFNTIKQKWAIYLLSHYKNMKNLQFTLDKTHEQISELFGVSRPALSRVLREMHNEGLLRVKGKTISITNIERLQKSSMLMTY